MDTETIIRAFVEQYNRDGSDVYALYGETVDWLEMPSGRRGGRRELFDALKQVRDYFTDMKLEILSLIASGPHAVLESNWTARNKADDTQIAARIIWFFRIEEGKIVKEHDYSVMPQG